MWRRLSRASSLEFIGHVLFSTVGVAIVTRAEGLGLLEFARVLLFEQRFDGQEVVNSQFELQTER